MVLISSFLARSIDCMRTFASRSRARAAEVAASTSRWWATIARPRSRSRAIPVEKTSATRTLVAMKLCMPASTDTKVASTREHLERTHAGLGERGDQAAEGDQLQDRPPGRGSASRPRWPRESAGSRLTERCSARRSPPRRRRGRGGGSRPRWHSAAGRRWTGHDKQHQDQVAAEMVDEDPRCDDHQVAVEQAEDSRMAITAGAALPMATTRK